MIGVRPKTIGEYNKSIYESIKEKEVQLVRPMREILASTSSAEAKTFAQSKVDEIETEIQRLRGELNGNS